MKPCDDRQAMRLVIRGIMAKGVTLDFIYDGEEDVPVSTTATALDILCNLDDAFLHVVRPDGIRGWIRFVMGNEPFEVVCDHTINLSEYIDPITDPWWK